VELWDGGGKPSLMTLWSEGMVAWVEGKARKK
jgi:hypothetical protein